MSNRLAGQAGGRARVSGAPHDTLAGTGGEPAMTRTPGRDDGPAAPPPAITELQAATGQHIQVEPDLRARVRAGDPDAFGMLFDQHAGAVYGYAVRLTGDRSAAEDVVSLTFLEAWRRHRGVHPEGDSLRPWLLGIAVNVSRNVSRAARRHQAALGRLPRPADVPDFPDALAARLDDAARLDAVRAALATLRRPEREVLALRVGSGMDYAAAAGVLGVPVGTVRSRLSRARRRLQRAADESLRRASEPPGAAGQVPDSRPPAARSPQERTR
jgi:RNA polymerase sigma-70 factor (ECF subfamily)